MAFNLFRVFNLNTAFLLKVRQHTFPTMSPVVVDDFPAVLGLGFPHFYFALASPKTDISFL